jgi:HEAT repeat protein
MTSNVQERAYRATNATQPLSPGIDSTLQALLALAADEIFEYGEESAFSRALVEAIQRHGTVIVELLASRIFHDRVASHIAAETLRWFGMIEHPASYDTRLWWLQHCLFHPSIIIRDAASLGLAALDDPRTAPALRQAIAQEPNAELRGDLAQVLRQLETHPGAILSPHDNEK